MSKLEVTVEMVIHACQVFSCPSTQSGLGYAVKNKGSPKTVVGDGDTGK